MNATVTSIGADGTTADATGKQIAPGEVMLFLPNFEYGGAQRVMIDVSNGLASRNWRVSIGVINGAGEFRSRISNSVAVRDLRAKRAATALPAITTILRQNRHVTVLSTVPHVNILVALAHRVAHSRARLILRESAAIRQSAGMAKNWKEICLPSLRGFAYSWADKIIAQSEGMYGELKQKYPSLSQKLVRIYNPVDTRVVQQSTQDAAPHPWLRKKDGPVIVTVGRLDLQKDHRTLLQSLSLARLYRDIRCIIVGDGPELQNLQALAAELELSDRVHFTGFRSDPQSFLAYADLFVLSSQWEGMPNAMLEALASGIPVVATDCEHGPREILLEGRLGRLCPVGDSRAMASAILWVLENPTRSDLLKKRAEQFSLSTIIDAYEDALTS